MFNYLKKYNIFCSSKLFVVLYAFCMFSISAEAKICFLPDSSCGTGKISSVKPDPAQCLYSSMAQAQNGMSSCEKAYKQNFCFYRRCKTREEDKNVFSNYSDCQKALEDNQTCQSCGGCYKIVTNANQTPNNKTCNETEATCSAKGKAFEANGEYDSNNVACGICKVNETCPSGYSTAYQSQKDCKTGETFSSNGTANGKVCGKCTVETQTCPSSYSTAYQSKKDCKTDETFSSNGTANGKVCGKCTKEKLTCESMGYETDYCSKSCEKAYKTGKQDYEGNNCYRCEPYDCSKKCSELNPNWVGEDVDCKNSGVPGPFWSIEWVYDEAGEPILGSDSDCKICKTLNQVTIVTADSPCYEISSITGSKVQKITDKNYRVDLGSDITVNTEAINKESRYCKYPNNILSVNSNNKYTVKNNSRNFTLDTEFLNKNNISSSSKFTIAAVDDVDPIEYVAKIVIENTEEELCESDYSNDCYCVIYTDLYIGMDDATDDTFMNGSDFEPKLDLRNVSGNMYSGLLGGYVFDGNITYDWRRNPSTNGEACNPVYASNKSEYYFYWGKNKEKIKMPYNSNRACIQLGTKTDNTRVCYEIENN